MCEEIILLQGSQVFIRLSETLYQDFGYNLPFAVVLIVLMLLYSHAEWLTAALCYRSYVDVLVYAAPLLGEISAYETPACKNFGWYLPPVRIQESQNIVIKSHLFVVLFPPVDVTLIFVYIDQLPVQMCCNRRSCRLGRPENSGVAEHILAYSDHQTLFKRRSPSSIDQRNLILLRTIMYYDCTQSCFFWETEIHSSDDGKELLHRWYTNAIDSILLTSAIVCVYLIFCLCI